MGSEQLQIAYNMNDFTSTAIPKWHIALWGILAVGAFAWVGHALGDRGMACVGLIMVPILITLMPGIIRMGRSQWTKDNLGLLVRVYIVLQTALLIWRTLDRR